MYKKALQARRLIHEEYARVFSQCDVLLGPTTAAPAFRLGEIQDPLTMYLCDRYTVGANISRTLTRVGERLGGGLGFNAWPPHHQF